MIIHPQEVPMDNPNMCFICEQTPDRATVKIVNTMRFFAPNTPHHLSGVKYLCQTCIETAVSVLGLELSDEVKVLKENYNLMETELQKIKELVKDLQCIVEVKEKLLELQVKCLDSLNVNERSTKDSSKSKGRKSNISVRRRE